MKKIIKSLFTFLLVSSAFLSCKKDEQVNYFRGGKDLTLTSSARTTTPYVFIRADNGNPFTTLSWTNPDFVFSTGVSSQNVSYTIEAKLVSSAVWTTTGLTITSSLSKVFSVKEINDQVLTATVGGLNLDPGVSQNVQFRLRASLGLSGGASQTFVYSNVFTYNLTPYSNDPDLWITGDGTGSNWTNTPPANQKCTYNRATQKFTITQSFVPGKYYKFLTTQGRWQPQWGLKTGNATRGTLAGNPDTQSGDPDAIPTPGTAGSYKITVDLNNKTLEVDPV